MSDDDKFITVPVRVPADLIVERKGWWLHLHHDDHCWSAWNRDEYATTWEAQIALDIAAAVEARKPKPPKFGPGDIVEWVDSVGTQRVGIIKESAEPLVYWLTDGITRVHEDCLKLVRRAEK